MSKLFHYKCDLVAILIDTREIVFHKSSEMRISIVVPVTILWRKDYSSHFSPCGMSQIWFSIVVILPVVPDEEIIDTNVDDVNEKITNIEMEVSYFKTLLQQVKDELYRKLRNRTAAEMRNRQAVIKKVTCWDSWGQDNQCHKDKRSKTIFQCTGKGGASTKEGSGTQSFQNGHVHHHTLNSMVHQRSKCDELSIFGAAIDRRRKSHCKRRWWTAHNILIRAGKCSRIGDNQTKNELPHRRRNVLERCDRSYTVIGPKRRNSATCNAPHCNFPG